MSALDNKYDFAWFVITTDCNLNCTYCWATKLRKKIEVMSKDTAIASMEFLLDHGVEGMEIQLFGGEPLLEWDMVKYVIERYPSQFFSIFTNGILFDREKLDFFMEYTDFVRVVFSIDGGMDTQLKNRGKCPPHMEDIERSFRDLRNVGVRMTVMDPGKVYGDAEYLCSIGCPRVDINTPVMMGISGDYKDRMKIEFAKIKESDFGSRVHYIEACNTPNKYCAIGTRRISISPNGDLYPCDMFGMMKKFKIGSVFTGVDENLLQDFMKELPAMRHPGYKCAVEKYVIDSDWLNINGIK